MKPQIEPELHKRAPLPLFACVPCWHNVLAVTCSVPLEENFSTILLLTTIASFFQHTLVTCLLFTRTNSAFFIYCVPPPLVFPSTRKHEPRCCEGSGFDDRFRVSIFWRCSYKLPIILLEPFSLFVWLILACGGSLRFFFILFFFTRQSHKTSLFYFPFRIHDTLALERRHIRTDRTPLATANVDIPWDVLLLLWWTRYFAIFTVLLHRLRHSSWFFIICIVRLRFILLGVHKNEGARLRCSFSLL